MGKKKPLSKNKKKQAKEKHREALHYKIFVGLCIANVVHYAYFEHTTLGSDSRYAIYVFWIPTLLGLLISSGYYIFNEIWREFFIAFKREKFFAFVFNSIVIGLSNFLFAYIIFGFSANAIWNYVNKNVSEKSPLETVTLPIEEFKKRTGRNSSNRIVFQFKENRETIKISYTDIKPYLNKSPDDYQLVLELREGIWNYYTLESWEIVNKKEVKMPPSI